MSHCIFQVVWKLLYSGSSSRDPGTLHAARNFLKAHNVSTQPMKDVNASVEFLDKYTDALIVSAVLEHFGMATIDAMPSKNKFDMTANATDIICDGRTGQNCGQFCDA